MRTKMLVLGVVLATAACGSPVSHVDISRVDYGGVGTVDAKTGITTPLGVAVAIEARPIKSNGDLADVSPTAVVDDPKVATLYPSSNSAREFVVLSSGVGTTVLRIRADGVETDLPVVVQATP